MSYVEDFFSRIVKAIPVLVNKIGTVLLFIFTVGLFAGFFLATSSLSPLLLLIPVAAMIVMWYKLDEGFFVLLLLTILVVFFPEFIDGLISALI